MNLYPGILTSSISELAEQVEIARASGDVNVIQIDIIDGYFAENLTISPLDLTQTDFGELKIDFHLMTEEPMDFIHEIIGIKEYLPVRAIIAQVERMSSQRAFLEEVKQQQWQAGLSLNLYTPVSAIDAGSWPMVDIIQLMTIEAGFQGQEFHAAALSKIPLIRHHVHKGVEIIVDGGVKEDLIETLKKADVDSVVVGSGLWDPQAAIEHFTELMQTEE